jgi:hypothetical protein
VVLAGSAEQQAPELLEREARDPAFDAGKTERWLVAMGQRDGYDVVSLTPWFRAACAEEGARPWYVLGNQYGHWNSEGHALAARALEWYFAARLAGLDSSATRRAP